MNSTSREENTFEDPLIAKEWIDAIESEKDGSRDREVYPLLKEWSSKIKPTVLLEIGSGQGICSSQVYIKEKYIGIEPSVTLIERAKEIYKETNKLFIVGNAYEIPVEDKSVDAIFSVGVWFHLENLDKAHKELNRILKLHGEVLIITSNPDSHSYWEDWHEDTIRDGKKIVGKVKVPTRTLSKSIFYFHTEEELKDSIERNGFQIKQITKFGHGKRNQKEAGIWVAINAVKIEPSD